jgi:hypothetical protein
MDWDWIKKTKTKKNYKNQKNKKKGAKPTLFFCYQASLL